LIVRPVFESDSHKPTARAEQPPAGFFKTGVLPMNVEAASSSDSTLWQHVIYRCVVGSRAYGLEHDGSDTDRRGIYLPPAQMHWSLKGVPEQIQNEATQEVYWELEKVIRLALKANPTVLEALWSPIVEYASPLAQELLAMRGTFLSKLVYQTYRGYAENEYIKLENDLRTRGTIKAKHAIHLIRLMLVGLDVLTTGEIHLLVPDVWRDRLTGIRSGQVTIEEIKAWYLQLNEQYERAGDACRLPEVPDYHAANDFLIRARRSMVM
jgi:predicted nucleotidyltransferase